MALVRRGPQQDAAFLGLQSLQRSLKYSMADVRRRHLEAPEEPGANLSRHSGLTPGQANA